MLLGFMLVLVAEMKLPLRLGLHGVTWQKTVTAERTSAQTKQACSISLPSIIM
jgi:hypothetical protein